MTFRRKVIPLYGAFTCIGRRGVGCSGAAGENASVTKTVLFARKQIDLSA